VATEHVSLACELLRSQKIRLQDLRMRYEKPNSSNRWDKPLFFVDMTPQTEVKGETAASETLQNGTDEPMKSESIPIPSISEMTSEPPVTVFSSWKSAKKSLTPSVISQSATSTTARDSDQKGVYFSGNKVSDVATICEESRTEALNFPDQVIDEILSYFETAVAPAPNLATKPVRHAGPELLYQLDRVSQTIVQFITAHQQEHTDGTPLILKDFDSHVLVLPRYVGAQELQRLRRQFVKMNSSHPPENSVDVGGKFVEFLRTQVV
jgi:tRNA uridine 5-carbamoylmethylation protein Kti12